jgi:hypothetical protein
MKNLSIAFLAAVSLVSFAGCKGKKGDMMAKMTEYKDQMCKCAAGDKVCADKVGAEWKQAMEAEGKEGKAQDPEEAKKYEPIVKQYNDCKDKVNGTGAMGGAPAPGGDKPMAPAGDKPADPAAPPAGDKPADPAAPPAGDKPAGDKPPGAN